MRRYRRLCAHYVVLILLCGCGVPSSVKATNVLNRKAADWIAEASQDPGIDRAAGNIRDGSLAIERKIGTPEVDPAYTPEAHAATVVQANADLDAQEAIKNVPLPRAVTAADCSGLGPYARIACEAANAAATEAVRGSGK